MSTDRMKPAPSQTPVGPAQALLHTHTHFLFVCLKLHSEKVEICLPFFNFLYSVQFMVLLYSKLGNHKHQL